MEIAYKAIAIHGKVDNRAAGDQGKGHQVSCNTLNEIHLVIIQRNGKRQCARSRYNDRRIDDESQSGRSGQLIRGGRSRERKRRADALDTSRDCTVIGVTVGRNRCINCHRIHFRRGIRNHGYDLLRFALRHVIPGHNGIVSRYQAGIGGTPVEIKIGDDKILIHGIVSIVPEERVARSRVGCRRQRSIRRNADREIGYRDGHRRDDQRFIEEDRLRSKALRGIPDRRDCIRLVARQIGYGIAAG